MKALKLSLIVGLMFIGWLSLAQSSTSGPTALLSGYYQKTYTDQLYSLRMDKGYGFVDEDNDVVIPAFFDDAEDFSEELGQVKIADKWGFVNRKGVIVIPPIYDESEPFVNGLAAVYNGDKWGYIDNNGKVKINFLYKVAGNFHENLAFVSETGEKDSFGFINKNGQYIVPVGVFDGAKNFSEGLAPVCDNNKWGYIDTYGKIVIPIIYEDAEIFSEGLAAVRYNEKWGYIARSGKTIIEFDYDYASLFTDYGALVSRNGESFVINQGGQSIPLGTKSHSSKHPPIPYSTPADWMKKVRDNALLYCLDLPGTHDSATYKADFGSYWQCQTKNITEQLNWGVRVFDIRLKMGQTTDSRGFRNLLTAHGKHTYDSFGVILDQCVQFLQQHIYESIILIIQSEESYDTKEKPTFNDSVEWYIQEACRKHKFGNWEYKFPNTSNGRLWTFTMNNARGKILLVTHDGKNENEPGWIRRAQQLTWYSDGVTDDVKDGITVRIQDCWGELYKTPSKFKVYKKESIERIKVSKQDYKNNALIVQYLSGSFKQTPYFVAGHLWPWFIDDMKHYREQYRLGWFMMDYVGKFSSDKIRDQLIKDSIEKPRGELRTYSESFLESNPEIIPEEGESTRNSED